MLWLHRALLVRALLCLRSSTGEDARRTSCGDLRLREAADLLVCLVAVVAVDSIKVAGLGEPCAVRAADAFSAKTGWALPVPHPACHRHVLGVLGPFHGCQRIDRVLWMSCEIWTAVRVRCEGCVLRVSVRELGALDPVALELCWLWHERCLLRSVPDRPARPARVSFWLEGVHLEVKHCRRVA